MTGGTSEERREALARGRRQAEAVRDYLDALGRGRRRGREPSEEELRRQLEDLQTRIATEEDPAKRVELVQDRLDAEALLRELDDRVDVEELERGFVEAAGPYSERKGITYTAWREAGVPARVLRDAGVRRTRRTE